MLFIYAIEQKSFHIVKFSNFVRAFSMTPCFPPNKKKEKNLKQTALNT